MVGIGDARQRRARLALTSRTQRQHLVRWKMAIKIGAAKILHAVEITGFPRHLNDALHRAADHHHLSSRQARGVCDRATLDANVVTATRPFAALTTATMVLATSVSEGERPSRMALVESPIRARTPASPSSRKRPSSVGRPTTGVGSIFQSPV